MSQLYFNLSLAWYALVGAVSIVFNYIELWLLVSAVCLFLYLLFSWIRKVREK